MKLIQLSKNKILYLLIILVIILIPQNNFSDDSLSVNNISKNLRCLICQGQSVYDSNSDFALSMKIFIQEKIEAGLTENEIYDLLIKKYGQWISYDPGYSKTTFLLWFIPLLFFLFGGAIIYFKIYNSKKNFKK